MKKEFIELTEFVPVGTNNSNQKYNRKEDMSNNANVASAVNSDIATKYNPLNTNLMTMEVKTKKVENYYNQIRMISKCLWEDLYFNGRIVEMLIHAEAKEKNIISPH